MERNNVFRGRIMWIGDFSNNFFAFSDRFKKPIVNKFTYPNIFQQLGIWVLLINYQINKFPDFEWITRK
jgi:hypothetical protein